MKLILCVDSKNGLEFNRHRQTFDHEVFKDIFNRCGHELYAFKYSLPLLTSAAKKEQLTTTIHCIEDVSCLPENAIIFAELSYDLRLLDFEKIDYLTIYTWNEPYLSTYKFTPDAYFIQRTSRSFAGSSHEKIECKEFIRLKSSIVRADSPYGPLALTIDEAKELNEQLSTELLAQEENYDRLTELDLVYLVDYEMSKVLDCYVVRVIRTPEHIHGVTLKIIDQPDTYDFPSDALGNMIFMARHNAEAALGGDLPF